MMRSGVLVSGGLDSSVLMALELRDGEKSYDGPASEAKIRELVGS